MQHEIVLDPEAVEDLRCVKVKVRAEVTDAIERYLRHEPRKTSRTRIKCLQGLSRPQFRLRVGEDIRVFYDVTENTVEVLAILPKSEVKEWLERYGETDEESTSD
jgi:mRNA-degrading endonuclease RelE of RelBE toxin-antitoxin system